ncbi:HHR072Wp [Eremothecium sinecaudum]|uniref:HHR072Wp n=1 Tax=Eremothecium sinecaudum TaxID=45286 RepID=A0A0X8HW72_9SACH|nr:HHR072Wp [Eremothecium sinecaudum]AMD22841.1 HHR072Wp [Eremothecium sinecaudum]
MNEDIERWLRIYLKCFINAILYYRNVYPKESFAWTTYQAFNLPRHMPINRYPELQDYIDELILDVLSKLQHVRCFNLNIIRNKETEVDQPSSIQVWERYVLDFSDWVHGANEETTANEIEGQVFDELRAALNDLLRRIETLPSVRPGSVTFEACIDAIDLTLGRTMTAVNTKEEKVSLDRSVNWVICHNDEFTRNQNLRFAIDPPEVQFMPLIGCEVGPIIIGQYFERILLPKSTTDTIYEESSE